MESVGKYITRYAKGKVPSEQFERCQLGMLAYLSPDYLRDKAQPEFYATPTQRTVQVDDGEVIVLWDGSNAGEVFKSKKGILSSTMVKLEFDEEEIVKPYFAYAFEYLEYFLKAKTAGSGIPHADKGVIKGLEFNKPSKPEQEAIAGILSKVDEAIQAVRDSIVAAEKLKKALMQNLLTGKLKPDGTWRGENEFCVSEKFGLLPKGWSEARVKDAGKIQTGKTPPTANEKNFQTDDYPFVTPGDLGGQTRIREVERFVSEQGAKHTYIIPSDSIMLVCIGSTIGKIGITDRDSCSNQQINSIIPNEEIDFLFLYYFFLHRRSHFKEYAGINATPQINKSDLSRYPIYRPDDIEEQRSIAKKLLKLDQEAEQKGQKIRALERLKKSLMQNLLTGKTRVDVEKINHLLNQS